LIAGFGIAQP